MHYYKRKEKKGGRGRSTGRERRSTEERLLGMEGRRRENYVLSAYLADTYFRYIISFTQHINDFQVCLVPWFIPFQTHKAALFFKDARINETIMLAKCFNFL